MTSRLRNDQSRPLERPRDNRPATGNPDLVDLPTDHGTVAIRPKWECAYCAQPVVIYNGQPFHAQSSDANCMGAPDPIKAWDA